MSGRHRRGENLGTGLDVIGHHVESYITDALSGQTHGFGAHCLTCGWDKSTASFTEADTEAERHRNESGGTDE